MRRQDHVQLLGILNVCHAALNGLGAFFALAALWGSAFVVAVAGEGDGLVAAPILVLAGLFAACLIAALTIPAAVAGYGLLRGRPWARPWTLVASVLNLLNVPIGTLVGAYGLWVMLAEPARTGVAEAAAG